MKNDQVLRQELLAFLKGGNAHMSFEDAVAGFPMADINTKVPQGSYTVWHYPVWDDQQISQEVAKRLSHGTV